MRIELDPNDLRNAPDEVWEWLMTNWGRKPTWKPAGTSTKPADSKPMVTVIDDPPVDPELEDPAQIIGDCESLMRELINLTSVGQVKEVLKPHNRLSECPADALPALRDKLIAAVASARKAGE